MATLKWLNRTERAVAALLSATVLFLLIVAASHAGALWRDECNSIQLARMSNLAEVRENYSFESFPVLFPIILRGFTDLFGTSDTALRMFGCVVGVTLLVVAWWNARVFQTVPLLFPPLIGLNTIFLVWGITVRGYGLGTALIALGLGLAVNALLRPGIKSFIALAIGWLAAVQVLYFNLMLVAAFAAGTIAAFLWRCYNCRGLCDIVCTVLPDVRRHRLECCREAAGDLGICLGTTHCRLRRTDALVIGSLPISVCGRTAWRAGRLDLVGQSADNRRSRTVLSDNFLRARADRLLFLSPSAQLPAKSLVLPGAVRRRGRCNGAHRVGPLSYRLGAFSPARHRRRDIGCLSVRGLATSSSTTHEHRHCCAKIAARGKTKRFDRGQSLELRRLV